MRTLNGQQNKRRRRDNACREQNWRCYYCGIKMIPASTSVQGQRHKPNEATIEHLDDRFSGERGQHQGKIRRVAACWQCNHDRAVERQSEQNIEELRERSKRHRRQ